MFDAVQLTESGFSKSAIHTIASDLSGLFGVSNRNDLRDVVLQLDGNVKSINLWESDEDRLGSIVISAEDEFTIFVPDDESETRKRFTIAHELGHYFLHYIAKEDINPDLTYQADRYVDSQEMSGRVEWEANWFAAALLMPIERFRTFANDLADLTEERKIRALAKEFHVSYTAAKLHANYLEISL